MFYRLIARLINSLADSFNPKAAAQPPAVPAIKPGVPAKPAAPAADPDTKPQLIEPAYLKKARSYIGIKETPGAAATAQVLGFFARAGHPGIKSDEVAWCAAFTNACLEEAGCAGSKQLNARSFLTWGKEVKKPYPGAVAVLWRNSPDSWEGHVGFFLEEDATRVRLLGGNQGNQVSAAWYPKSQLLGYREPPSMLKSRTAGAATVGLLAAGAGSSAILESQQQVMGISAALKEIGVSIPSFQLASQILGIVCLCVIMYARYQDMKDKGR